ncbi:MAG: hypothetical protein H0T91_06255, partial [Propionibacteriaceae bacterium]|nr:hypothetical protein [Propionibacteriaceae bacterium]
VCRQRPGTAKGVTFPLLEDEHGLANAIVYPSLYQEYRLLVRAEPFLLVEGLMQRSERTINIIATRFHRLAEVVGTLGEAKATPEFRLAPDPSGASLAQPEPRSEDVILEILAPRAHSYR